MLKRIKSLIGEALTENYALAVKRRIERRQDGRTSVSGARLWVQAGSSHQLLRLANLSCGGASGLLDRPLGVGETVIVRLDPRTSAKASVSWAKSNRVGLQFAEPLAADYVENFWANCR